jgi:hypothetical protein
VPSHADPSVYSLPVDTLSHNFPYALLHALAMLSTISLQPFHFAGALPALDWVPNCHSNPITQRVRRKRQRLPPSLLIENASGVSFRLPGNSLPEAFPIKASDHSSRIIGPIADRLTAKPRLPHVRVVVALGGDQAEFVRVKNRSRGFRSFSAGAGSLLKLQPQSFVGGTASVIMRVSSESGAILAQGRLEITFQFECAPQCAIG